MEAQKMQEASKVVSPHAKKAVDNLLYLFEDMVRRGAMVGWDRVNDQPSDRFIEVEGNNFMDVLAAAKLSIEDKKTAVQIFRKDAKAEGYRQEKTRAFFFRRIFPQF